MDVGRSRRRHRDRGRQDPHVALKADGTVWSWGYNGGDGCWARDRRHSAGVTGAGSRGVRPALRSRGDRGRAAAPARPQVGRDGLGLGIRLLRRSRPGNPSSQNQATQVPGVTGVTAIAAAAGTAWRCRRTLAHGNMWAWGLNDSGQLPDGSTTTRYSPVLVRARIARRRRRAPHVHSQDGRQLVGRRPQRQRSARHRHGGDAAAHVGIGPRRGHGSDEDLRERRSHARADGRRRGLGDGLQRPGPARRRHGRGQVQPGPVVLFHDTVDIGAGNFRHSVYTASLLRGAHRGRPRVDLGQQRLQRARQRRHHQRLALPAAADRGLLGGRPGLARGDPDGDGL